ncbi:MAG: endo alpha-1,4 polygalactosaminidase [Myxococcota bacterium]
MAPAQRPELTLDAAAGTARAERWHAHGGTTWQIQLEGALERTADVQAYDVDLFEVSAREIAALQRDGRAVICYFSAGSWEEYRPDVDAFPEAARGNALAGFPDERWLDIRREDVRAALVPRFDLAVAKGCDAVDPDNVHGFSENTGFDLSAADQLDFNRWLAARGHERDLAVGLKNDLEQAGALVGDFDFAVNESCLQFDECDVLRPFIAADKAVFHIEYQDEGSTLAGICADPTRAGFSTVLKRSTSEVDAFVEACDP